ncbi:hypothetical protein DKX38_022455 [Salix brachista]|uniref:Pentatricopeptide repeat-containing protein n=1 Tax=Salix brachista TaxID=2182728 RepID=A0A5N5K1F3_9ROSI|nr:hypothetical protein DKX38_022455 [Salix brachista]
MQEAPVNKCHVIIKEEKFKSFNNLKTIEYAHQLFDEMPEPNVVSWTLCILVYPNTLLQQLKGIYRPCVIGKKMMKLFKT